MSEQLILRPYVDLPPEAVDVLRDGQWHRVTPTVPSMSATVYRPVELQVERTVTAPFSTEPAQEDSNPIPIQFWREEGSWQREGFDLMCRGLVITDGHCQIPATLLVIEEGAYIQAIDQGEYDQTKPVHHVS